MLPVWNWANALTANSVHSAAARTAKTLGLGLRVISAPFMVWLAAFFCRSSADFLRSAKLHKMRYLRPLDVVQKCFAIQLHVRSVPFFESAGPNRRWNGRSVSQKRGCQQSVKDKRRESLR